jgi:hypothetical protein
MSDLDALTVLISDHSGEDGISPRDAAATLIKRGWRPPAQVITTPEEAEALPARTVVMDSPFPEGDIYQRTSDGFWVEPGFHGTYTTRILSFPVTVLYRPTENGEAK